jgi:hemerythrin-like domain-containing protein
MTTPAGSSPNTRPDPPAQEMNAVQILMHEHSLILQALSAMEERISRLQNGTATDRVFFEKAVEFLRTFADRCHHGKEEDIFFTTMVEELDYPRDGGPVAVLTSEHQRGRDFIRGIAEAAAALDTDPTAAKTIVENGRGYIQLLRTHIDREDTIVFPMVEQFLDDSEQARLAGKFEKFERQEIESGRRAASLRLLDELMRGA